MLDYLVLYQSESGNTKKIAASIFSRLPGNSKDLIDIDTDKTCLLYTSDAADE